MHLIGWLTMFKQLPKVQQRLRLKDAVNFTFLVQTREFARIRFHEWKY